MPQRIASAEFARLSSLYRLGVLDTEAEPAIDGIVRDLAATLDVPVAQLVFADAQRFWAKSGVGPMEPTVLRGRGLVEDLITAGPAFLAVVDRDEAMPPPASLGLRSFAGLRLAGAEDDALGVLYVADIRSRDLAAAAEPLAAAAATLHAILDSSRRAREDEGTGALDADAFLDQTRRLVEVSRTGRQWISLVTLDLAPLRSALEAKGPGLGSLIVRHMADLGRTQVRRRDSFGRLDDDLFAIVLTDTGEAGARVLAQRLTRYLERGWADAGLDTSGLDLGMASVRPSGAGDTAEALLARASAACQTPANIPAKARVA